MRITWALAAFLVACSSEVTDVESALDRRVTIAVSGTFARADISAAIQACETWNARLDAAHRCSIDPNGKYHLTFDAAASAPVYLDSGQGMVVPAGQAPWLAEAYTEYLIGHHAGVDPSDGDCGAMRREPSRACVGFLSDYDLANCRAHGACD